MNGLVRCAEVNILFTTNVSTMNSGSMIRNKINDYSQAILMGAIDETLKVLNSSDLRRNIPIVIYSVIRTAVALDYIRISLQPRRMLKNAGDPDIINTKISNFPEPIGSKFIQFARLRFPVSFGKVGTHRNLIYARGINGF